MVQDPKGTLNVQSKVSLPLCPLPGGISVTNSLFISLEVLCASIGNYMHVYTHICTHICMLHIFFASCFCHLIHLGDNFLPDTKNFLSFSQLKKKRIFLAMLRSLWDTQFPDQGLNLCPLQWQYRVPATGPRWKPLSVFLLKVTEYAILCMSSILFSHSPLDGQVVSIFFHCCKLM